MQVERGSRWPTAMGRSLIRLLVLFTLVMTSSAFQSDELILEDEEFGLEGIPTSNREISTPVRTAHESTDSKSVQIALEHAIGDSDFSQAGIFTARLKTLSHGGQTLTKLRFKRNVLTDSDKDAFKKNLRDDDFYRIRLPSNVLFPGKEYVVSSVRVRCLARESLDEHFVINMDGVNILSVTYGSSRTCQYPRSLVYPKKWSFNSYTVLKSGDVVQRRPAFAEEALAAESAEGEGVKPPEKSFWAKYWMYLIPLGLIVMNAITQVMNLPDEPPAGQGASQGQQQARAPSAAVRRR
ncbi:ER membrane protein complex subunit-like protein [Wolffia australiana]